MNTKAENSNNSPPKEEDGKLSQILQQIFDPARESCSFGELVDELDHHGMAIILILFSIPSALPIPAAGYSTVLSIPLLCIGLRLLVGKETIWLPEKLRAKEFRPADFQKINKWMSKIVTFIEKFSKPRLVFLAKSKIVTMLLGILIIALGCFMALPIPGTNTLPAGGIFLIGFGLLEDDGLLIIAGVLYALSALLLGIFILKFGYDYVKEFILEFL